MKSGILPALVPALFVVAGIFGLGLDTRALYLFGAIGCLVLELLGLLSGALNLRAGSLFGYVIAYFVVDGQFFETLYLGAVISTGFWTVVAAIMTLVNGKAVAD